MTDLSSASALSAAVRIVRGESDRDAVMRALEEPRLAYVIACAPDAQRDVRAIAALRSGLTSLLNPPIVDGHAFHAALARLIGTPAERNAIRARAEVAPAGWDAAHADALRNAVVRGTCFAGAAAALIGPNDDAAALLRSASDAAFAIRRWGQSDTARSGSRSTPAAPTAWMGALSAGARQRLIATVESDPSSAASCLPWLPPDVVTRMRIDDDARGAALDAFAAAPPTGRAMHADIVQQLVARAHPTHLAALTRLACAMQTDEVWSRVQTLLHEDPNAALHVVIAAPWNDLANGVRNAILERADASDICAAIAAACGRRDVSTATITGWTVAAFFAALNPRVWDALDAATQRRWRHALRGGDAHLAVRALGLRPEFLARATLDNDLVRAVQRHARGEGAWRATLLPVALRHLPLAAAHAVIAALPPPPDPGAFFCIAGGCDDPDVLAPARSALRTPADLALAIVLLRSGTSDERVQDVCDMLRDALHGRARDELKSITTLLAHAGRNETRPARAAIDASADASDRRGPLRRTFARLLADVPPESALPAFIALDRWMAGRDSLHATAEATALALSRHGDAFASIVDALGRSALGDVVLPLPKDDALADALRGLAQDDPPTAQRLAHALRNRSCLTALQELLHAAPAHASAVWQALDDATRRAIGAEVAAASPDADPLAVHDPIAALALAAVHADDADLRAAGITALAQRPDVLRQRWGALPTEMQHILRSHLAVADMTAASTGTADMRQRRRYGLR